MFRRNPSGTQDDERLNVLNDCLELLVQDTENLLEGGNRENPNCHDGDITRRIAQFKPSTYDGNAEPQKLENWVREIEKIFAVVGCPDIMKVNKQYSTWSDKLICGGVFTRRD